MAIYRLYYKTMILFALYYNFYTTRIIVFNYAHAAPATTRAHGIIVPEPTARSAVRGY